MTIPTHSSRITNVLFDRAEKLMKQLEPLDLDEYYIGGNSLNGTPLNDIDVFPDIMPPIIKLERDFEILQETPNAVTLMVGKNVVQLCKYHKPNLAELVESFDFAHIQVGARVGQGVVCNVEFTEEWISSNALGRTWYTGSDYPISSLTRLAKYASREHPRVLVRYSVIAILHDIFNLADGAFAWSDFIEQMKAVDVLLTDGESPGDNELRRRAQALGLLMTNREPSTAIADPNDWEPF
jgi:hypothetical protein